jgi:TRAP-type mannitol/chloroaromatic compound transport system permease large subunit
MLAGLYVAYVILRAVLNPSVAPKPPPEETRVDLPEWTQRLSGGRNLLAMPTLVRGLAGHSNGVARGTVAKQLLVALLPAVLVLAPVGVIYANVTSPVVKLDFSGLQEMGGGFGASGVQEPPGVGIQEPPAEGVQEPPAEGVQEPPAPGAQEPPAEGVQEPPGAAAPATPGAAVAGEGEQGPVRRPAPAWFWIVLGAGVLGLALHYSIFTFERLQIFKMLLTSFFPLSALILAVLGTIIFGWATPTEAAAMGAAGGILLAAAYRKLSFAIVKESAFLCARTTAMVCWLFIGSSIFSAAFALLGGQAIVERWVLSLNMSPLQFMLLAQFIIFILGWPLEWTEIIVIFMPIFLPLLGHFQIDPLFFGLLVAMNLQTAFLSPPVAMAAFYLKGVAPKHVTLNQIFAGMLPFMAIQVLALFLLYMFPSIGLWLPGVLYK